MLNNKITLYVPSTMQGRIDLDEQRKQVEKSLRRLATWFGGATAVEGQGAWVMEDGTLVVEPVVLVYCYVTAEALAEHLHRVKALAYEIGYGMSQECVSLEVNGELRFVDSKRQAEAAAA